MRHPNISLVLALLSALALAGIATAQLPDPGMEFEPGNTALVVTDPQNDFLSPDGDGYAAALVNFRFTANDVLMTCEAVKAMDQARKEGKH